MPGALPAEDDPAVGSGLPARLERDRYEVVAAPNVRDALRSIATKNCDPVLSDLHMPKAGGGNSGTPAGTYTVTISGTDANRVTQSNIAPTTVGVAVN
jgi:CheY-like chemotaxis protein